MDDFSASRFKEKCFNSQHADIRTTGSETQSLLEKVAEFFITQGLKKRIDRNYNDLDSIEILAELRPLVLIIQFDFAQFLIHFRVFLLVQTQNALKRLPQLLPFVFENFFIELWLLHGVEF